VPAAFVLIHGAGDSGWYRHLVAADPKLVGTTSPRPISPPMMTSANPRHVGLRITTNRPKHKALDRSEPEATSTASRNGPIVGQRADQTVAPPWRGSG